jgi:hypothetical protein
MAFGCQAEATTNVVEQSLTPGFKSAPEGCLDRLVGRLDRGMSLALAQDALWRCSGAESEKDDPMTLGILFAALRGSLGFDRFHAGGTVPQSEAYAKTNEKITELRQTLAELGLVIQEIKRRQREDLGLLDLNYIDREDPGAPGGHRPVPAPGDPQADQADRGRAVALSGGAHRGAGEAAPQPSRLGLNHPSETLILPSETFNRQPTDDRFQAHQSPMGRTATGHSPRKSVT